MTASISNTNSYAVWYVLTASYYRTTLLSNTQHQRWEEERVWFESGPEMAGDQVTPSLLQVFLLSKMDSLCWIRHSQRVQSLVFLHERPSVTHTHTQDDKEGSTYAAHRRLLPRLDLSFTNFVCLSWEEVLLDSVRSKHTIYHIMTNWSIHLLCPAGFTLWPILRSLVNMFASLVSPPYPRTLLTTSST